MLVPTKADVTFGGLQVQLLLLWTFPIVPCTVAFRCGFFCSDSTMSRSLLRGKGSLATFLWRQRTLVSQVTPCLALVSEPELQAFALEANRNTEPAEHTDI